MFNKEYNSKMAETLFTLFKKSPLLLRVQSACQLER